MSTRFIFNDIPFSPDIDKLSLTPHFAAIDITDEGREAWSLAAKIVRPKATIIEVGIEHDDHGKVVSIGGLPADSTVLDRNLSGVHRAFIYAATCGREIYNIPDNNDDEIKALLFTFRIMALGAAIEFAGTKVREIYGIEKTAQMNPGSLPEWPITEQKTVFTLLGTAADDIGVSLGDNMFMNPMESSSGIIFAAEHDYKNCMACTRFDCIGRQAPYDPKIAAEIRGKQNCLY